MPPTITPSPLALSPTGYTHRPTLTITILYDAYTTTFYYNNHIQWDFDLLSSHRLLHLNANTMLNPFFLPIFQERTGRFLYYYHGISSVQLTNHQITISVKSLVLIP